MSKSRYEEFLQMVPEDWKQVRISEAGSVFGGGTPSRTQSAFWNGDIPWVTPGEITKLDGKLLTATSDRITRLGVASSAATMVPRGSLLVTTRATIGAIAIAGVPVTTNQGFKNLVPAAGSDSDFLFYLLQRVAPEMQRLASGSTFDEISKRDFAAIRVPLPTLPEQRRIAEVLDTADEAIRQTDALIAKLKQTKQGLLHDLLTRGLDENGELRDPVAHPEQFKDSPLGRIPRGWKVEAIGALIDSAVDGPFGSNLKTEHYVEDPGVRVVRLQNINSGWFDDEDRAYVSEKHATSLNRHSVVRGDLLVASLGDTNHPIARACLYPSEMASGIVKADCFRLRCNSHVAKNGYVMHVLNCPSTRGDINLLGQGVTRDRVNLTTVQRVRIRVPPIDEQDQIIWALSAHDGRIRIEEAYRDKLRLLKQGLMQDLLTGRVRVPISEGEI